MMATFYAAVPIIPIYCQEIGITGSKVGIVLTAMSITTVLFRPFAGYILDNFNRYRVYLLFLALFSLPFLGFALVTVFSLLVLIRLYIRDYAYCHTKKESPLLGSAWYSLRPAQKESPKGVMIKYYC